jgi:anti-sigma factor ChrR (cupin superfamily)
MDEPVSRHPSDETLASFLRRSASAGQLAEVDRHLAACEDCRTRLEKLTARSYSWLVNDIRQAAPQQHLEYEDVAALAEGRSVPAAAAHLRECAR